MGLVTGVPASLVPHATPWSPIFLFLFSLVPLHGDGLDCGGPMRLAQALHELSPVGLMSEGSHSPAQGPWALEQVLPPTLHELEHGALMRTARSLSMPIDCVSPTHHTIRQVLVCFLEHVSLSICSESTSPPHTACVSPRARLPLKLTATHTRPPDDVSHSYSWPPHTDSQQRTSRTEGGPTCT